MIMKIVNFQEFMKLPSGTVFCEVGENNVFDFGTLQIKYENMGVMDFVYKPLFEIEKTGSEDYGDKLCEAEDQVKAAGVSKEIQLDYGCTSRDGLFDNNRFFAVFNKEDVAGLIASLQKCL